MVIDSLHDREPAISEEIEASNNMEKANKGGSGVRINTMTMDEGITAALRVKREHKSLAECIKVLVISVSEGGVLTSSALPKEAIVMSQ